ncbi:diacylglycerol/lipid kinase family protein [Promicromonospora soli]|uniref:Sphingosine kinase n=1 Tax=Promicromonospora soli TaxID=2035533 RepID=A0A919KR13_9MICO|nr:diacylglycerol kinase family protein [Promicromonospora soli]GHH69940.1 sphingosine kinase [Promicromonospora soli]
MEWQAWLGVAAIAVALLALAVAIGVWSQQAWKRRRDPRRATPQSVQAAPQLAVIVNPSKQGAAGLLAQVRAHCSAHGLPEPLWYETTVDDPGKGQAQRALDDGADIVVAAGGDGTVRAVAETMVGANMPMGVLPVGTGNLLARNLELPLASTGDALDVIVHGRTRAIDVGWLRVTEFAEMPRNGENANQPDHEPDTEREHIFLVIAGLGFDAAMVATADADLKKKVGWLAYFVAGLSHMQARRMRAHLQLDDQPPVEARARSIMVGNVGMLPGGVNLLPDAVLDDGVLDVAAVDVRGGVFGWAQLTLEIAMQGVGVRNELPEKLGRIDHTKARRARIQVPAGEEAQVDGDPLGRAVGIDVRVQPGALLVRAP